MDLIMRFFGSFNAVGKAKFLESIYLVTIALLLSAVVFTPVLITHHFLLINRYVIQEDAVEAVLILVLLLNAYLLSKVYKRELKKYRQVTRKLSRDNSTLSSELTDAFKYIGGVNVQIQEIRSIFCGASRLPATENEFRRDMALLGRKLLGIVNADWVVIRIIGRTSLKTIKEHLEARKNAKFSIKGVSNKAIVASRAVAGYATVASCHDNSMILVACVFPQKSLDQEEKILSEAIANQIEMLYLIFISGRHFLNPQIQLPSAARHRMTPE